MINSIDEQDYEKIKGPWKRCVVNSAYRDPSSGPRGSKRQVKVPIGIRPRLQSRPAIYLPFDISFGSRRTSCLGLSKIRRFQNAKSPITNQNNQVLKRIRLVTRHHVKVVRNFFFFPPQSSSHVNVNVCGTFKSCAKCVNLIKRRVFYVCSEHGNQPLTVRINEYKFKCVNCFSPHKRNIFYFCSF